MLNAYSCSFVKCLAFVRCQTVCTFLKKSNFSFSFNTCLLVWFLKVKAVQLFLTPEELDDPVNRAKKYFLQTGT